MLHSAGGASFWFCLLGYNRIRQLTIVVVQFHSFCIRYKIKRVDKIISFKRLVKKNQYRISGINRVEVALGEILNDARGSFMITMVILISQAELSVGLRH